mmetsp:Transcript_4230/g.13769  ORF Transcript_4230/g.13769 Transcript_4230/m.13769 type:complete len:342 (-) Transcript_4230:248-1273(-)
MFVVGERGSPTRHEVRTCSTKRRTNSSCTDASTRMRLPHKQISPWFANAAVDAPATAASMFASAKTMVAFFPPSSSETFLKVGAAAMATLAPVTVPPVKVMSETDGWAASGAPADAPVPVTRLNTPGGKPACRTKPANMTAVMEVNSAGFSTMVLPYATAGATFHVSRYSGMFHGTIAPTTPTGITDVHDLVSWSRSDDMPSAIVVTWAAKNRQFTADRAMSTDRANDTDLPQSRASAAARASACSSMRSARRLSKAARSAREVRAHAGPAALAAQTAASTSAAPALTRRPYSRPVAGSKVAMVGGAGACESPADKVPSLPLLLPRVKSLTCFTFPLTVSG